MNPKVSLSHSFWRKRSALTACQCGKSLDQTDAATLGSDIQGEFHTAVEEAGWMFSNVVFLAETQN